MTEVADETTIESPEAEATEAEAPTTPAVDEATWKKRLAGKDQALTAAQRERDQLRAEAQRLSAWKAEKEQADLTELERAQAEIKRFQSEAEAARAEATAARLAARYPLAAEALGDDIGKLDETKVAELNGRLSAGTAESVPAEPRIDPNSPRKNPPRVSGEPSLDDLKDALTAQGNPFFEAGHWK